MREKVLLAMTRDSKIYECVEDNINFIGYDCELLNIPIQKKDLEKRSIFFKLKLYYKLKIVKNKKYISRYKEDCYEENILKKIQKEGRNFKYCLIIRPDLFSEKIIDTINKHIEKVFAYQWDGLDRFPKVLDLISKFKHFYIYDKKDLGRFSNTSLTTNFYFDCFLNQNKTHPEYDVYYLGSYDSRISDIISLCKELDKEGLKMKILVYCPKIHRGKLKEYPFITEIHHGISYYKNLEYVFNSRILLDFTHQEIHSGLSLRPFEALGFSKKLITTNSIIREYDFYNKKNILIYDKENEKNKLNDFLKYSYSKISEKVYEKYSFSFWFNNLK